MKYIVIHSIIVLTESFTYYFNIFFYKKRETENCFSFLENMENYTIESFFFPKTVKHNAATTSNTTISATITVPVDAE